ncbi:MAG: LamB/YcsF family protein, partial [Nitrospirota bacterium]|nr:LamB/YcsF family protein [Nitrospirota bacterium]
DPEHFGRMERTLSSREIEVLVVRQIETLANVLSQDRLTLTHAKPHGALYNMAGKNPEVARAIVKAVQAIDRRLVLYAPACSELAKAAHAAGLPVVHEAFADRAYRADGSLVPRSEKGAVLQTEEDVRRQLRQLMMGYVTSVEGSSVPIQADSLCLHTDMPHAVSLARMIRHELEAAGIRVAAMYNESV